MSRSLTCIAVFTSKEYEPFPGVNLISFPYDLNFQNVIKSLTNGFSIFILSVKRMVLIILAALLVHYTAALRSRNSIFCVSQRLRVCYFPNLLDCCSQSSLPFRKLILLHTASHNLSRNRTPLKYLRPGMIIQIIYLSSHK